MDFSYSEIFGEQCGAIFKTKVGLVINCTICETIFKCFQAYTAHIEKVHFATHEEQLRQSEIENPPVNEYSRKVYNEDSDDCSNEALEEDEHSIVELISNTFTNSELSLGFNKEECEGYQKEIITPFKSISTTVTIERNIQNDDDTEIECRPVRKKTMYFEQPDVVRNFKCTICSAAFKDSSTLRKHVVRHATKKTHQCPLCQKKFYTLTDMKVHQRFHSKERPFLCTVCGLTCISNIRLKDHMRRHTNQRDYKCPDCDKCFFNASLLAKHKAVHSSDRPYICNICEAQFAYRKGLQNHKKLHENKREYKCELCGAGFNQQAGLFCHLKNKHKRV